MAAQSGLLRATSERSIADVLRDVVRDMQDIVRLEVRLAKAEVVAEAGEVKTPVLLFLGGAVAGMFAMLFLLLGIAFALALILPIWAATLIVGAVLTVAAGLTLAAGVSRFRSLEPPLGRTMNSLKENVEWAKQHSK